MAFMKICWALIFLIRLSLFVVWLNSLSAKWCVIRKMMRTDWQLSRKIGFPCRPAG